MGPFDMMLRDLREMHVISVVVLGLPVASVLLLAMRRWLAVVPLAISAALGLSWFLYYARDWPNPGLQGALYALFGVLVGWLTLGIAEGWHRYRPRSRNDSSEPESTDYQGGLMR